MQNLFFSALFLMSFSLSASVSHAIPSHKEWAQFSAMTTIPIDILYALALMESGKTIDGEFIPHPYAIAVGKDESIGQMQHEGFYPASKKEAVSLLAQLLADGHTNIGIGMMQINIKANPGIVEDITTLLDPVTNFTASAKVLKWCSKHKFINAILSCYSHGAHDSQQGLAYANKVRAYEKKYAERVFESPPIGQLTYAQLLSVMNKQRSSVNVVRQPSPVQIIR